MLQKSQQIPQLNLVQLEVVYEGSKKAEGVVKGKLWF